MYFFLNLGAMVDPRYKRTRIITRRVLTGLTCIRIASVETASRLEIQSEVNSTK